jgi:hypothetical protein
MPRAGCQAGAEVGVVVIPRPIQPDHAAVIADLADAAAPLRRLDRPPGATPARLRRRDPQLPPLLSIAGLWCLLVFVALSMATIHVTVDAQGLPSLSHNDLLHGLSESPLTLGNLMIVLGLWLWLRRIRQAGLRAAAAA